MMSGNRLKGTPVRRRCAQEVPRRRCQRLQRGKVACAKSARDLGAALAPGERSLGFCGLAPVTPLRERLSLDAQGASEMDSNVVVMETLGGFPNLPALWLRRARPAYAYASGIRPQTAGAPPYRPIGAFLTTRAPSLAPVWPMTNALRKVWPLQALLAAPRSPCRRSPCRRSLAPPLRHIHCAGGLWHLLCGTSSAALTLRG